MAIESMAIAFMLDRALKVSDNVKSPLKDSVTILLVTAGLLYVQKPSVMFNPDGSMKPFGTKVGETTFPFFLATSTAGVSAYYLSAMK
jgi:hypothetical protein